MAAGSLFSSLLAFAAIDTSNSITFAAEKGGSVSVRPEACLLALAAFSVSSFTTVQCLSRSFLRAQVSARRISLYKREPAALALQCSWTRFRVFSVIQSYLVCVPESSVTVGLQRMPALVRVFGVCFLKAVKTVLKRHPKVSFSHRLEMLKHVWHGFYDVVEGHFACCDLSCERCRCRRLCTPDSPELNWLTMH